MTLRTFHREMTPPQRGVRNTLGSALPEVCRGCQLCATQLCGMLRSTEPSHGFPARVRYYERDSMVFEEGQKPALLGVLKSGFLRKERLLADGRRTILGLARPGEIIGNVLDQPLSYSVEAATDVEVCSFDDDAASQLMTGNESFRNELLLQTAILRDLQLDMIWLRGALTSRERIMAFLVTMAGFLPASAMPDGSVIVTIELSRRDWADMSNTTPETISRTMTDLSRAGLVASAAPHRYRITDLNRLARMAGMDAAPDVTAKPRIRAGKRRPKKPPSSNSPRPGNRRLMSVNAPKPDGLNFS